MIISARTDPSQLEMLAASINLLKERCCVLLPFSPLNLGLAASGRARLLPSRDQHVTHIPHTPPFFSKLSDTSRLELDIISDC